MRLRKLCAQCGRWVERTPEWFARQPDGVVLHPGACRVQYIAEQRHGDAMQWRAETVLAADAGRKS
jgi:hypothetical protein